MNAKPLKSTNQPAQKPLAGKSLSLLTSLLTIGATIGIGITFNPARSWAGACAGVYSSRAGAGSTSILGYYNSITKTYTDVVTYPGGNNINALATQPSTGNLFFVNRATGKVVVYNVNTGSLTTLAGTIPTNPTIIGATFLANGKLYVYYTNATLVEVNPATGAQTGSTITISGIPGNAGTTNGDIAVGTNGTFYALGDTSATTSQLYSVTVTGAATATATAVNGSNNISGVNAANGLAIDPATGKFYISASTGTYELDPVTKVATSLAGAAGVNDLAACASSTPDLPTITKAFSPSSVTGTPATSTLTLTLGNTNTVPIYTLQTLTDTLPAGLAVSTPNGLGGSCTAIAGNTVTATAGSSAISLSSGFNIPAAGCTVNVNVTTNSTGSYLNNIPIGALKTFAGDNATPASATLLVSALALDFGDAPDSYGTLLASNGARHTISGLYLGAGVSAEADGQPNATATGDTNDDGVTFSPSLGANYSTLVQAGISNQVTVVSSGAGFVNAWLDYNQNGTFDAGEQILTNQPVVAGTNTLTFTPANTVLNGSTFARFRLSPISIAAPSAVGLIAGGEVEDYQVQVAAPVPNGAACTTTGLLNGGFELPVIGATSYSIVSKSSVPGWNTTASDQMIEIWSNNYTGGGLPVPSYAGNQFAEMNANQKASLYQDIATSPGTTLTFQFAHRARAAGTPVIDSAAVAIGAPGALVPQGIYKTDSTDWIVYSSTYIVPPGQYITRVQFDSLTTGLGDPLGNTAVGNFLDGVELSVSSCVTPISPPTIDLDGNNSTAPGNNYQNTFTIGGAAVAAADTDVVITDEKTNITRAIFLLTNTPDGTNESLTIDPTAGGTVAGVTVDLPYDSTGATTTGRLTLKGSATLANYQKIIATLKYSNTKAAPTTTDRIINVQVIDSDKAISNTAISTIKLANAVSISGTVFNDSDGSKLLNGAETGTNAGGLNAVLIDSANKVVATTAVAANGTYTLSGVTANATYTLQITTATATVGAAPPAITLPSNWVSTGENLNGTIDGTVDSKLSVAVTTGNVVGGNFGIKQAPLSLSGTVFSDADADVTINGSDAGTNAGSASLTIYAVDGTGKVVDKATVSASGTYSLTNIPASTSLTLRLSNDSTVAVGGNGTDYLYHPQRLVLHGRK